MSSEAWSPSLWADVVLQAFRNAGLSTDAKIGAAGGPSTTTLTRYRNAVIHETPFPTPRDDVFDRIDTAAKWPAGTARRLWTQELPLTHVTAGEHRLGPAMAALDRAAEEAEAEDDNQVAVRQLRRQVMDLQQRVDTLVELLGGSEAVAARRLISSSKASQVRAAQNAAGEENQDPGDHDDH